MTAFSLIFDTVELREPTDDAIAEAPSIGEATLQHMDDGRAIIVSPQATQENIVGFYIKCFDKYEAQELARSGVMVFDGDRIFESLTEKEKALFNVCAEEECHVDNPLIGKIVSKLDFHKSTEYMQLDLPIKYYCPILPALLPNEMQFLKTAAKPNIIITINTNKTKINY